ncbi:MAG TPA: DUF3140 domain-containing protein [Micromonosporaceae bacterium]|nr:DUF3140 domain-containing protein [Micromonosporaceae bacterium]
MPIPDRADPEMNELWEQFHSYVNVNSQELRHWLMTRASGEESFSGPHQLMPEPGKSILAVLAKRKVDLTDRDMTVMREVVAQIEDLLAARPAVGGTRDDEWRHNLMDLGHDPVREV